LPLLLVHGSILSRVGASGKPGAVHNDEPRLINTDQKRVFETLQKIREQLKIANQTLNGLIRKYEIYTDIRNMDWNFQHPLIESVNELLAALDAPIKAGESKIIDSKETDKLKLGINTLGQWIEKTKGSIQEIRKEDDAADIHGEKNDKLKQERRALIQDARAWVVKACAEEGKNTGFRAAAESYPKYFELRPYLSAEFLRKMNAPRTVYLVADGSNLPALANWFLNELDRLEGEWDLR